MRTEVLAELRLGPCADDRDQVPRLGADPRDRNLRGRGAELVGDRDHLAGHRIRLRACRVVAARLVRLVEVLPGQRAPLEHAPRREREAEIARHRQQLALDVAVGDRVRPCTATNGDQPYWWASVTARETTHAGVSEMPT